MLTKSLLFTAGVLSSFVAAAEPTTAAPVVTDDVILQYALTLEHLEAAFYKEALEKFSEKDFKDCGVERTLFEQIAEHEATHVQVLQGVLGSKATQACKYSFPYSDVHSFKALAQVLEGVGVTAYLGAAQYLTSKPLLTAAAAILSTEARHAAWLATTNDRDPWPGAFDTPLAFSQVYSLAAPFIVSCPATNPTLPVKRFPELTLASPANGSIKPNSTLKFTVPHGFTYDTDDCLYVAFLSGLGVSYAPYTINGTVSIPNEVKSTGTIYAVITNSQSGATDDTTVAGPAVLIFEGYYPTVSHSCGSCNESEGSHSGSGTGSDVGGEGEGAGAGEDAGEGADGPGEGAGEGAGQGAGAGAGNGAGQGGSGGGLGGLPLGGLGGLPLGGLGL